MASWRLVLCDRNGAALSILDNVADQRVANWRLNRSASLSFRVPSDAPQVATVHTDGYPYLEPRMRVVKAWRKATGASTFDLKFVGEVWNTQDDGEQDTAHTTVTCFDPLQGLTTRMARRSAGWGGTVWDVVFGPGGDATDPGNALAGMVGTQIAQQLIDMTNLYSGNCGITTTGGTFETNGLRVIPVPGWVFKPISDALLELTDAWDGFDIRLDYLDQTDGTYARFNGLLRRGTTSGASFAWGPHGVRNIQRISRLKQGDQLMNSIWAIAPQSVGAPFGFAPVAEDSPSIGLYGRNEIGVSYDQVTGDFYSQLSVSELNFRKVPRETVTFTPMPDTWPRPFTDYDIGDTVNLQVGTNLRGGFTGVQRVYGFEIAMEDVETVRTIVTSPE